MWYDHLMPDWINNERAGPRKLVLLIWSESGPLSKPKSPPKANHCWAVYATAVWMCFFHKMFSFGDRKLHCWKLMRTSHCMQSQDCGGWIGQSLSFMMQLFGPDHGLGPLQCSSAKLVWGLTGCGFWFIFLILKYFIWSWTQIHIGISSITAMLNIVLWPKRMGHETGTVYMKSSPEFGS